MLYGNTTMCSGYDMFYYNETNYVRARAMS